MSDKRIFVLINMESVKDHYAMKINSYKRVDGMPKDKKIIHCKETIATACDFDFSYVLSDIDPANEKDCRFLTPAYSFCNINENEVILEFDEDSYGKFVYLTKMEKGAFITFD